MQVFAGERQSKQREQCPSSKAKPGYSAGGACFTDFSVLSSLKVDILGSAMAHNWLN